MAPWLFLGLLLAGVAHVCMPPGLIRKHLGKRRFSSVLKAVAIGIPMPLCSCGVIPATLGLKKEGASDGAAIGFLISTPQTGLDSIFVSAAFLGLPFALFKVLSALASGLIGGLITNLLHTHPTNTPDSPNPNPSPPCCHNQNHSDPATGSTIPHQTPPPTPTPAKKNPHWLIRLLKFSLGELFRDMYKWLIIGIIAAAVIAMALPAGSLENQLWTQGLPGMFLMLLISLPMYVCATASVPLAASLIVAGMSPGSALVLLMAGPTTNLATLGSVLKTFGPRITGIYFLTVAISSMALGMTFNYLLAPVAGDSHKSHDAHLLPQWLNTLAAMLLLAIMASYLISDIQKHIKASKN